MRKFGFLQFRNFIQRHPFACYFIGIFTISWACAFIIVATKLLGGGHLAKMDGILMFPVMIIVPCMISIFLTAITEGKSGLRSLASRMTKWKVAFKWYMIALLIPPILILIVLFFLRNLNSFAFTPNFYPMGTLFGIQAGFFEEIG